MKTLDAVTPDATKALRNEERVLRRQVADFYGDRGVAEGYSARRYAGAGGERVAGRELRIVSELLPPGGRVLDVACGTGRLGASLGSRHELVGLDLSSAMLREAHATGGYQQLARGDAFSIPFADGSYDAAIALRLVFHFADPGPIIKELARVTRPGGVVVFEACNWSPRAGHALDAAHWGPRIFVHRANYVKRELERAGLEAPRAVDAFLVSPVLYRLLPPMGTRALERLESALPRAFRCRSFWQARVPGG
jgi:SAM-dependent methyltransferase